MNSYENDILIKIESQETVDSPNQTSISDKIDTRAYVIAMRIYYQLHNRESEYNSLIEFPVKYEEALRFHFQVKKISTSLYKNIDFDYKDVLNNPNSKGRIQLKKQFEQIINAPEVFSKELIKRVKEIYEKHFKR